jgi:hypothetical protein
MNPTKLVFAILFAIMVAGAGKMSAQNNPQNNTQDGEERHSTVQVSFFPPLGTNGTRSGLYTNDFSFNILAGVSRNERAFALAGLANVIRGNATGFQLAGLANYTGGEGRAMQLAGLANIVRGDHTGLQWSGLANTSDNLNGFQIAGLTNITSDMTGVQIAGLANIAGDVDGFQLSGLFNVAKKVCGVQFASLVNVAEESDYPIGLVNIIKEGEMGIAVAYNEIGTASLTFRSGGRVMYGILGFGYNHRIERRKEVFSIVGGWGAHINILPWLRINNEITMEQNGLFSGKSNTFKAGYALLPAFRPVPHIEIFGGPSINYMYSSDEGKFGLFPNGSLWKKESTTRNTGNLKLQHAFVGWQAGVQFLF